MSLREGFIMKIKLIKDKTVSLIKRFALFILCPWFLFFSCEDGGGGGADYIEPFKSFTITFEKGVVSEGCLPNTKITGLMDSFEVTKPGERLPAFGYTISDSSYSFMGWADEEDGDEVKYADCAVINFSKNKVLRAVWGKGFNIRFNQGTADSTIFEIEGTMGSIFVAQGDEVELPPLEYTFSAHRFLGWATSSTGAAQYNYTDKLLKTTSQSLELFAVWKRTGYAISFDSGEMTLDEGEGMEAQTFLFGTKTATQTSGRINSVTFARRGATFLGWGKSETDKTIDFAQNGRITLTSDIKLFAKWQLGVVWITFVAGTAPHSPVTGFMARQEVNNASPTKLNDLAYSCLGYDFYEWTFEDGGETKAAVNADVVTIRRDTVFTATWRAHECKASFFPNGGKDTSGGEAFKLIQKTGLYYKESTFRFPFCPVTLEPPGNLYFVGWGLSPTAKEKDLFAEGEALLWEWSDDVKFYAVWEIFE